MPYGTIKIDTITFTDGGVDKSVPVSGLVLNPTFTGNVTVTGTISGDIIQGGTTVSGLTVTGTTANFASGVFTTQVSGLLITGPTVSATTGTFTSLTGTTTTGTTANFASGVFTTQISGVTITGTTVSTTTGNFTSLTGTTATITSGIIASGTAALPSLAILSDPDTGIYSPGADQLAVATNGVARLSISSAGEVTTANEKLNLITVGRGPGAISSNTAVGFQSLLLNTTGNHNTAIGRETLLFNTIGSYNTANGFQALISNDSGSYNTAIGHLTISTLTTGSNNTAIGHQAFLIGNGSSNTCLGYSAGSALSTGSNNTIIGSIVGTAGLADTVIIAAGATERLRITSTNTLNFVGAGTAGSTQTVSLSGSAPINSLVLDSSGRLGIGTSSPGAILDVAGGTGSALARFISSAADPYLRLQNTSAGGKDWIIYNSGTGSAVAGALRFYNNTDNATPLTLDSSGRVGIGTSSPGKKLTVYGTSNSEEVIEINNTSGSANGDTTNAIRVVAGSGSHWANLRYTAFSHAWGFGANPSVSEAARIDSSGRLLVGTSTAVATVGSASGNITPQQQLVGSTFATASAAVVRTAGGSAQFFLASGSSGNDATSDNRIGGIYFNSYHTDGYYQAASIEGFTDTPGVGSGDMPGRLVFSTTADGASSPTERMRISSTGAVLIGTTTSEGRITIAGNSCGGYIGSITNQNTANCNPAHGLIFRAGQNGSSSGSAFFSFRRPDDTVLGTITQNGATAIAYNTSSDYRLKENVVPVDNGISRLQQLKPSRFNFIEEPGRTVDGFLAHEVQTVVPEAITGTKDAVDADGNPVYQGIDQSKLVPLLTAALQEAIAKIETLEARLTALESA